MNQLGSDQSGFNGTDQEWKNLKNVSLQLEDSLLLKNNSLADRNDSLLINNEHSEDLFKKIEEAMSGVPCLQTDETLLEESQNFNCPSMLLDS